MLFLVVVLFASCGRRSLIDQNISRETNAVPLQQEEEEKGLFEEHRIMFLGSGAIALGLIVVVINYNFFNDCQFIKNSAFIVAALGSMTTLGKTVVNSITTDKKLANKKQK
jgi:hypothetical protein